MNYYTYVILRKDLTPIQRVVQASHAALEAGFKFEKPPTTSYLIVLVVDSENDLKIAQTYLRSHGIDSTLFYEPDFGPLGYTALATETITGSKRKHLSKYKMLE